MASTVFSNGTVVQPDWLNDVNNYVYNGTASTSAGIFNVKAAPYNAVGNGITDDSAAIQAAVTAAVAAGGTVLFPPAIYRVNSEITVAGPVMLLGYGATISLSTSSPIATSSFKVTGANVRFKGLTFDLGVSRLTTYNSYPTIYNAGIYGYTCSNLEIEDCTFSNLYTVAVYFYNSSDMIVKDCVFTSPAQLQALRLEHILLQTCSGNVLIENNTFTNSPPSSVALAPCGVFASGTSGMLTVKSNKFSYCGRDNTYFHRLGVIDLYGNSSNVYIEDNIADNCLAQFMRVADVNVGTIKNNEVSYKTGAEVGGSTISIESTVTYLGVGNVGSSQIQVVGNTFKGDTTDNTRYGVIVNSYDYGVPSKDITISDNFFLNFGTVTQVNGPFDVVRIERNSARGSFGSTISQKYTGGGITITSLNGVNEASSFYKNLYINGNVLQDTGSLNKNGITLDMTKSGSPYTGTSKQIEITKNKVYSSTANTAQGIAVNMIASANTAVVNIRENEVTGYNYGLYIRNCLEVTMEQNKGDTIATGFILQSSNTAVNSAFNRFSSGPYAGRAVLVAGTVTVSTAEVISSDNIVLSRVVTGGTTGQLSVGTITGGTSFVINSSNAADTSTVFWQIVH